MEVEKLELEGLLLVTLDIYRDDRGFFCEKFHEEKFKDLGISENFIQDNHSRSAPKVLRGLHFQNNPGQGKLVSVVRGSIFDVVVDIRKDSSTYGKWTSVEISEENGRALWVPEGFAHGFVVTSDHDADVTYKVTGKYNPKGEGGIIWNDPDLGINWPISDPVLSDRDQKQPAFSALSI